MQQVHRALLEQAAGTWPLIFGKCSKRIQTCDHNVNGNTFSELVEFRDAPGRQKIYNIAACFDDVELIRQLPILTEEWSPCRLPDKCGKSVVAFLFDQLDYETQIIQGVLHKKFDRLAIPIRLEVVCRILSIKDDDEIRQCILSAEIIGITSIMFDHRLSAESVQWLIALCSNDRIFSMRQLWGTDRFEEAAKIRGDRLLYFTDCGLEVVLDLASRFPHWDKTLTLSKFIIGRDEAAVGILWRDHFEELAAYGYFFDLDDVKWILSLCDQQQFMYLQKRNWRCRDFEVAKYLHTRGFMNIYDPTSIWVNPGKLFVLENNVTITISDEVTIAVLDELYTLGYRVFNTFCNSQFSIPVVQWVARQSGLPQTITFETPTSQKQLEWVHSHYVFDNTHNYWKIKE